MPVNLRMVPIDLGPDGKPRDEKLYAALQTYCEGQFGSELNLTHYARTWAIIGLPEDGDGNEYEVIGATAIRSVADVPLFHVTPPTADREGLKIAEQARDMAVYRLYSYLEDLGSRGNNVLIYVSEKAERYWRRFLTKLKAKPANRWEMTI